MTKRVAILISGRGSNMMALVEAMKAEGFPAQPVLILANRPDAGGLEYAKAEGLPTAVVDHTRFDNREAFDAAIHAELKAANADIVCLAGFMRLLTPGFVNKWTGRMFNIHPSLLPKYPGLHTHQRAIDAGDTEAGCTVHYVVPEMDAGEIIGQARVPVLPGDTADTLAERVIGIEHSLYVDCLRKVCVTSAR